MAGLSKNFVDSTNIGEGDEAESPEMLMLCSLVFLLSVSAKQSGPLQVRNT